MNRETLWLLGFLAGLGIGMWIGSILSSTAERTISQVVSSCAATDLRVASDILESIDQPKLPRRNLLEMARRHVDYARTREGDTSRVQAAQEDINKAHKKRVGLVIPL